MVVVGVNLLDDVCIIVVPAVVIALEFAVT